MDSYGATRSTGLAVSVVGVLAIGSVFAYALPAVTQDFFGETDKVALDEIAVILSLMDRGWVYDLARLGVVAAMLSALVFPKTLRYLQAMGITSGAVAGLVLPIYVLTQNEEGESLGPGLILFAIACVSAAVLPWAAMLIASASESRPTARANY